MSQGGLRMLLFAVADSTNISQLYSHLISPTSVFSCFCPCLSLSLFQLVLCLLLSLSTHTLTHSIHSLPLSLSLCLAHFHLVNVSYSMSNRTHVAYVISDLYTSLLPITSLPERLCLTWWKPTNESASFQSRDVHYQLQAKRLQC